MCSFNSSPPALIAVLALGLLLPVGAEAAHMREKRSTVPFDPLALIAPNFPYPQKKNLGITGFNMEEKESIMQIHNAYRSLVVPFAADMVEMQWDNNIAAFAQEWAEACTATHRPNRDLHPFINMGENLHWWYGGKYHEGRAVKFWWDELQHYNHSGPDCTNGEVCGHYITMVWAKSARLGCGVARCSRLADLPDYGRGAYYIVCSYSGRFVDEIKPYHATDTPCSSCYKTGFPKCRFNLCVTQEMIDNDIGFDGNTDITGLQRNFTLSAKKSDGTEVKATPPGESEYAIWLNSRKGAKNGKKG